jgi:hypothetical protein
MCAKPLSLNSNWYLLGNNTLEHLNDVNLINPQPGDFLKFDGSEWVAASGNQWRENVTITYAAGINFIEIQNRLFNEDNVQVFVNGSILWPGVQYTTSPVAGQHTRILFDTTLPKDTWIHVIGRG